MNKKAVFLQLPMDMWGWFIFFLGILFWIVLFTLTKTEITYEIQEKTVYLSNDGLLLTYLQTPVNSNENIADLITKTYFGEDPALLKKEINEILNSVYGRAKPVCWKLWYYDPPGSETETSLASEECTGEKSDLLDARTIIPLQNKKIIQVRLIVPGYK